MNESECSYPYIVHLQPVLNAATISVNNMQKFSWSDTHDMPRAILTKRCYWLDVDEHAKFPVPTLMYCCLHSQAKTSSTELGKLSSQGNSCSSLQFSVSSQLTVLFIRLTVLVQGHFLLPVQLYHTLCLNILMILFKSLTFYTPAADLFCFLSLHFNAPHFLLSQYI
jgi:hypothetical protein